MGAGVEERDQIAFRGLLGLSPLWKIDSFADESPNSQTLRKDDVILRLGTVDGPTSGDFAAQAGANKGGKLAAIVLRDEAAIPLELQVRPDGTLGIYHSPAWNVPLVARTIGQIKTADGESTRPNPAAAINLFPRSRIVSVAGRPVTDWRSLRENMLIALEDSDEAGTSVPIVFENPTPGADVEMGELPVSPEDLRSLRQLTWAPSLDSSLFDRVMIVRSANGNPMTAIAMGFEETRKATMLTYLTLDRLIRRTVSIDQLRGPVGIVHLGTKVADKGYMYLVLLLAMISVNLAVLNFLPLPIVDGGLFLFLVYEKIRRQPPPLWFQNAATVAGLMLIACLFLVTFYNDVMRLIG